MSDKVDAKKELSVDEQAKISLEQYEKELQNARNNLAMWSAQVERLIGAIAALRELFHVE